MSSYSPPSSTLVFVGSASSNLYLPAHVRVRDSPSPPNMQNAEQQEDKQSKTGQENRAAPTTPLYKRGRSFFDPYHLPFARRKHTAPHSLLPLHIPMDTAIENEKASTKNGACVCCCGFAVLSSSTTSSPPCHQLPGTFLSLCNTSPTVRLLPIISGVEKVGTS